VCQFWSQGLCVAELINISKTGFQRWILCCCRWNDLALGH
jgi:hypothetical protein